MLLSIVMMMKNEEKYLDKTLKALQPIMRDIKSELIILDTGSTDSSVDIAKKYTEKVYFEKWNNNFSDMRNKSISYAKGEWILILDADEELMNYKKLKDFFETGKYKEYNTGTIELKNIFSEDETKYSLGSIPRLFRNTKDFRYEGAIHEQPKYKNPVYNNIAIFKHYGYMFQNEELRQLKTERNMRILLNEVEKNPNSPYINYQIAQSYTVISKTEDALFYLEKSYELYKKLGRIPIYVTSDLARLYLSMKKLSKCEKICVNYIKNDNKNIDIYFYLASAKKQLGKFKESLEYYEKYMYLLENYYMSTQANNMECAGDTISFRDKCELSIIDIHYSMENYNEIVKRISEMDTDTFNKVQGTIFNSLYKIDKLDKIVELYSAKTSTVSEKIKFKDNLEYLLLTARECDKSNIHSIYNKFDGNYKILNSVRLGEKISTEKYNDILKAEKSVYYGDLLYYALKENLKLENILSGVSYLNIKNYIDYIVINRKDIVLDLYNYLIKAPNTLDEEKTHIYLSLSKSLLNYGNLIGEKYRNIFYTYITFSYICIKRVYSREFSDEKLLKIIRDKEDEFVIRFIQMEINKKNDQVGYIKNMKNLLLENPHHKNGLELVIKDFEKYLDQSEEIKELKENYICLIKNSIQNGNLNEAKTMLLEYEKINGEEDILNLKAVYSIYKGDSAEAERLLKLAYIRNIYDIDIIFNIAYLKETLGEIEEAKKFYSQLLIISDDAELKSEINLKLELISS